MEISKFNDFQKKSVSSDKLWRQIVGAMLEWHPHSFWTFVLFVIPLSLGISYIIKSANINSYIYLIFLNLIVWLTVKVCRRLLEIFSLRKKDVAITWCYITILLAFGIWIICFLLVFNVKDDGKVAAAVAVVGIIISIVFQDKIKGVVAFLHLRMHHLLNIGDWIKVPCKDIVGEVKRITLTSVIIYNSDTTTSVIPISLLHSDHFINLQNMIKGNTYGRRMLKTFIFDTNWFCLLSKKQIEEIQKKHNIKLFLTDDEIKYGILNAKVYRLYLYHWLMSHEHVSQVPRLIISWKEQKESGMPLQVYIFITDSTYAAFEWQQSLIIEHIIESASWFNMQLYQDASAYDVSNSNIFLNDKPATYRKEDLL